MRFCLCLSIFEKYFYKLLKKIINLKKNKRRNRSLKKDRNFITIDIKFLSINKLILFFEMIDLRINIKVLLSIKF